MTTIEQQMMTFSQFKVFFQQHFSNLIKNQNQLFVTDVAKDDLWDAYLGGFPEEEGVRQSFNCNSCRQFIKSYGNLVALVNNRVVTLWDFQVEDPIYQNVINRLNTLVKSASVRDVFLTENTNLGTDYNFADASTKWEHFYYKLPSSLLTKVWGLTLDGFSSELRQSKQVFKRSLDELTIDATETVLDLISQNTLYRGEEYKGMLQSFLNYQKQYKNLTEETKDNFCWANFSNAAAVARMRNTAIGTLLIDISNEMELEQAVRKFEAVMAPANYKRPKAIISQKMIEQAENLIQYLGYSDSLGRRYATYSDIPVENVLFVNRNTKKKLNGSVFDDLKDTLPVTSKSLKKVEEVTLTKFIEDILPTSKSVSVLLENQHENNMVSLIAPINEDAPSLFKWRNGLGWTYNNNLADSDTKQRVKNAGGQTEGKLRVSLSWNTFSDLDLHAFEPNGTHIYYGNKSSYSSRGCLDIDQNAGGAKTRTPVENIIYPYDAPMKVGKYPIEVNNYSDRELTNEFTVEIEFNGEIHTLTYSRPIKTKETVKVAEIHYDGVNFTIKPFIDSSVSSKEIWGIKTQKFHPVSIISFSPNYWEEEIGNRHVFFMIEGCKNPINPRGIFNEFLKEELTPHRKVFEALGSRLVVEDSDQQLSGLGFSTTSSGSFIVEVEGTFKRQLKVTV